jgi:hypothetical protein
MKKISLIISAVFLSVLIFSSLSCNRNDEINKKQKQEKQVQIQTSNVSTLEKISKKTNKITLSNKTNKIISDIAVLTFNHNQKEVSINAGITNTGRYIFDMDNNGTIDLQVQPINHSLFYYLDEKGNKISKAQINIDGSTAYITIVEVYTSSSEKYGQLAKKGKWRRCFEQTAGSAEGIAGAVICNFGGPWCLAGYYSGIALGCLI